MYGIIGTWKMSLQGVSEAYELLCKGGTAGDAVIHAVMSVENNPAYTSVGYGGLPDRDGHVMTDSAYMDGRSLRYGGIISAEHIANPICAARLLCGRETNCLLAGRGAEQFATENRLARRDMRTQASIARWREGVNKEGLKLNAYRGHDTVCVLALDDQGGLVVGTSTSGLFMKAPGRVGDSPIIGSGFYSDARFGAAAATGLGEDIMRGCLSYQVVALMRDGVSPTEACENALKALTFRKMELGEEAGSISLIALAPDGHFGAATTLPLFPFTAGGLTNVRCYAVSKSGGEPRTVTDAEIEVES